MSEFNPKVDFFLCVSKEVGGIVLALSPQGMPDAAVALSFQSGMTEEMILDRVKNAFRTLAAGIAEDSRRSA